MFSDGVIDLIERCGYERLQKKHPGKVVTSFAIGTDRLYHFVDDNPASLLEAEYVNDTRVIRAIQSNCHQAPLKLIWRDKFVPIRIGTYQFSGVGGQMDFIRGASLSDDGKPIIALSSATKKANRKLSP